MRKALEWLGGSFLVYAVLAACSSVPSHRSADIDASAGEAGMQASSGQPSNGGEPSSAIAGKASAGGGGLLDPVPPAMAAAGSGSGGGGSISAYAYDEKTVDCDQVIRVGATDSPAAILTMDPPSMVTAGLTIIVTSSETFPGWKTVAPGGLVKPDGSQVAAICPKGIATITFLVPR